MYLIISWFYSLGKISGIVPEPKLKNWKAESREIQEEILPVDSVFQNFPERYSGIFPETFRNICGETEKLKNWKTEKLKNWIFQRDPGRDSPYGFSFSVFLFFSFSVLLTELFRNISGDISEYLRRNWKTEKLKNRKTEKLNFPERSRKRFSIWIQFFSFSVLQFCLRNYSGIFPETFRNICGELKNIEKLNFLERSRKRFSNGFSFSVFKFRGRIGQEELDNCILRVSSSHVM